MKKSELKNLIREEIRRVLNEKFVVTHGSGVSIIHAPDRNDPGIYI